MRSTINRRTRKARKARKAVRKTIRKSRKNRNSINLRGGDDVEPGLPNDVVTGIADGWGGKILNEKNLNKAFNNYNLFTIYTIKTYRKFDWIDLKMSRPMPKQVLFGQTKTYLDRNDNIRPLKKYINKNYQWEFKGITDNTTNEPSSDTKNSDSLNINYGMFSPKATSQRSQSQNNEE